MGWTRQNGNSSTKSTSAAQGPVPQGSHDEDAACYEDWAEAVLVEDNGENQGYAHEGEHEQGDKDQEIDQMPVNPDYNVYIVGEPHRKKAFHAWTCGMIQKWRRDLPENVREVPKSYATSKGLRPCKQCRP